MKILFVCTGNTCRSPLAEAIAKRIASDFGQENIVFESAGTQAWEGSAASDAALLVGVERNIDLSSHRSRRLTPEIVQANDLILVMSSPHLAQVRELDQDANVHLLGGYGSGNRGHAIADPFGGDLNDYRSTADELEKELAEILSRIRTS
jgi:protein-tyrosine-phosphatase